MNPLDSAIKLSMCLITPWKFPRITLKDKVVYKVLLEGPDLHSPCRLERYKLNKVYREPLKSLFGNKVYIDTICYKMLGKYWRHSYLSNNHVIRDIGTMYKAIIPRFTFYYKGIDGEICSKKLKIIEKCV